MLPDSSDRPEEFPSELKAFEASLGALAPRAARCDRDRMMYEAGVAAVELRRQPQPAKRRWLWPATAAVLALVATGLGTALLLRGESVERIVYVERSAVTPPLDMAPSGDSRVAFWPSGRAAKATMLALREQALRAGVDSLDAAGPQSPGDAVPGDAVPRNEEGNRALLDRLLGS